MRDKIIKAVAKNETIRIIACSTTDLINHIKQIHKLNELTTIAFGRLMTIASMISSTNKVLSDTIVIKFEGNGPLNNMSAITRGDGTLKGYISNSNAFVDSFKMNDLIGEGFLTITKDLGLKNPYTGKVPLYKSDVCSDLSYYYTLSEQTPTAISVGIDINEDFSIKNSVGIMVQMLPGADEMLSDIISYRFEDLGSIVSNLEKGKTIYDILNFMFDDMDMKIIEEKPVSYKCDCSRDKVERALISIGKDELKKIIDDNKIETIVCDYCKTEYIFENKDIKHLYNIIFKKG